jgi:chromosome segregation ATPase
MSETLTLESDRQIEKDSLTDVEEFEVDNRQIEGIPPLKPVEALRDDQTQLEAWVHQSFAALERLHSELDQWQRELTKQQVDLDESLANGHESSEQLEKLQQQCDLAAQQLAQAIQEVRQLEEENGEQVQEIDKLDRQFTAVQAELKVVREHAEQLTQNLESERQRAAEQQQHWSSELKEMRLLLDRQCELMVRESSEEAPQAPGGPESKLGPERTEESQVMEEEVSVAASDPMDPEAKRSDEIRRRAKDRRAAKRRKRKLPE